MIERRRLFSLGAAALANLVLQGDKVTAQKFDHGSLDPFKRMVDYADWARRTKVVYEADRQNQLMLFRRLLKDECGVVVNFEASKVIRDDRMLNVEELNSFEAQIEAVFQIRQEMHKYRGMKIGNFLHTIDIVSKVSVRGDSRDMIAIAKAEEKRIIVTVPLSEKNASERRNQNREVESFKLRFGLGVFDHEIAHLVLAGISEHEFMTDVYGKDMKSWPVYKGFKYQAATEEEVSLGGFANKYGLFNFREDIGTIAQYIFSRGFSASQIESKIIQKKVAFVKRKYRDLLGSNVDEVFWKTIAENPAYANMYINN